MKTLVLTRDVEGNATLAQDLNLPSCQILSLPSMQFSLLELVGKDLAILKTLVEFDYLLFTSVKGVSFFAKQISAHGITLAGDLKIACIGSVTSEAVENILSIKPCLISKDSTSEIFAQELLSQVLPNQKFLIAQGSLNSTQLADVLTEAGHKVEAITVYANQLYIPSEEQLAKVHGSSNSYFLFMSPSAFRNTVANIRVGLQDIQGLRIISIGPTTSAAISDFGLTVDHELTSVQRQNLSQALENILI